MGLYNKIVVSNNSKHFYENLIDILPSDVDEWYDSVKLSIDLYDGEFVNIYRENLLKKTIRIPKFLLQSNYGKCIYLVETPDIGSLDAYTDYEFCTSPKKYHCKKLEVNQVTGEDTESETATRFNYLNDKCTIAITAFSSCYDYSSDIEEEFLPE